MSPIFSSLVFTVFFAEFCERFAYYGSVFLVPNFMIDVMGSSQVAANVAVNLIYAIAPLSSLFAFYPADRKVGKPRVLVVGMLLYAFGVACVFVSSLPVCFDKFPGQPGKAAWAFFSIGIGFLSIGYGAFKTVSAPLVSDGLDCCPPHIRPRAFLFYTWVINFGALGGTVVTPWLRQLASPPQYSNVADPLDRSRGVDVAFYIPFGLCAGMTLLGFGGVIIMLRRIVQTTARVPHHVNDDFLSWRELKAAVCDPSSAHRQTWQAVRIFLPLPFFWLIQNQFMGNVMLQAQWTTLPQGVPSEVVNNINTIVMLVGIVVLDLMRRRYGTSSHRSRMLVGFAVVAVTIVYCAAVQREIVTRGYFTESEDYSLYPGNQAASAYSLFPAYVASGICSALIDPTVFEAAFQRAHRYHRSLVMAMYLIASSLSGFLGLALAPLATPELVTLSYAVMATLLSVVSVLWARIDIIQIDERLPVEPALP